MKRERPTDPIVDALKRHIVDLLAIKGRLELLKEFDLELRRLGKEHEAVRNENVLRLLRDSFDMSVINLCSLRDALAKPKPSSLLHRLKRECARLRRVTPDECDPPPVVFEIPDPVARESAVRTWTRRIAAGWNQSFDELFPGGSPVTEERMQATITRFLKDTEPTDRDRNMVRAHRHEPHFNPTYFQRVPEVLQQVGVFEHLLSRLYNILTHAVFIMEPPVAISAPEVARDLTDLVLRGSILEVLRTHERPASPSDLQWDYEATRDAFYGVKPPG